MKKYDEYLKSVMGGDEEFDGEKLRGIVDEVMLVVYGYLDREIDVLVGLGRFEESVDWMLIFEEVVLNLVSWDMK